MKSLFRPLSFAGLIAVSALAAWVPAAAASADTVTLSPEADTYVELGDADDTAANHGPDPVLELGRFSIFSDYAILIRFDLSGIPAGATINSATLSLAEGPNPYNLGDLFELSAITESWDEATVSGDTAPGTDAAVIAVASDPNPSIGVTFLIDDWVNGGVGNFGLQIQNTGFNDSGNFVSSEGAVAAPSLVVEYVPEPSTIAMILAGGAALGRLRRRS